MSIHFHQLTVKEVRKETPECVSVLLDVPEHLQQEFNFTQGQSLTVRKVIDGQELRRTYSICSSPLDKQLRIAIKKVEGGAFSGFANEKLKKGDLLDVMQPVGKFNTALDPAQKKNYIAFAAGSGITPVLSLISTTLRTEPESSFTLVYGNRNRNTIIFKEELEALKDKFMQRFRLYHILSREKSDVPLFSGRMDLQKLQELTALIDYNEMDEVFICGPEQMIFCISEYLEQRGIPKKNIHFELFTTPGQTITGTTTQVTTSDEGPQAEVAVKLDGMMFNFKLSERGESILDAALKQGADLPYACKGGVCTTCKAKLLEGKVNMDVHWGLEQEEIDQGFILTCQSHPVTEKVVVDFDVS